MVTLLGSLCALVTAGLLLAAGRLRAQSRRLARATTELHNARQQLMALHRIALTLSTTLDLDRLLEMILDQVGQLWGYQQGAILLFDDASGDLVVAAAREYPLAPGQRVPSVPSEFSVPLVWAGQSLGMLTVARPAERACDPADFDLLATVAEQAAAAIGNARLHREARDLAITDPHTGLCNYRHFQEQLPVTVRDAQLTATTAALLMLDLDFFKRVNDTYGHPTGDAVLQQFSRLLRESCRAGDLLFRYGGEEFAVILPGAAQEVALRVAERIRERVAGHAFVTRSGRRLDFPVTVSIGVACYPKDCLSHGDWLIAADNALYAAKAGGRNRVAAASAGAHPESA